MACIFRYGGGGVVVVTTRHAIAVIDTGNRDVF